MGKKLVITGLVIGVLFAVVGLTGVIVAPKFIHSFVTSNIKLQPGTDLYKQWLNPPLEVFMSFYLFNLKNPEDFENGARPIFEEVGPFIFQEFITKENLMDNQNNTLTYDERRRYTFRPDLNKYNLSQEITTINLAPITVMNLIRYYPSIAHTALNLAFEITNETLVIKKTANELLFGYKDNLLAAVKKILDKIFPDLLPSDEIGLFQGKNNTVDGRYTVLTGVDDYKKIGIVESWNGLDKMKIWSSDYANMMNGTDGTILPAFIDKDKPIYIFNNDLCRSLYVVYNKTDYVTDDIEVYKFGPEAKLFAYYKDNPDNIGFCIPPGPENCLPAGVLNMSTCQAGAPVIMSSPHFLFADPVFLKDVDGLNPIADQHNTFLYVEPTTGVLMKANKRVQFNTKLFRDPRVDVSKNIPEIMFPIFWADEHFEIDKKNADIFVNGVRTPLAILSIGKFVIFAVGLALILICAIFAYRLPKKTSEETSLVNQNSINRSEQTPLLQGNSSNQITYNSNNDISTNSIANEI